MSKKAPPAHLKKYLSALKKTDEQLVSLMEELSQDIKLQKTITPYRVDKTLAKINETRRLLSKTIDYLNGAKIEPDAKHPLIMPKQADLL